MAAIQMGVTAGIFLTSILLKEMRYLVYIRYLWVPLEWLSFWDSFDVAVNKRPGLSDIEKFNYLRAQLMGEAQQAIAGIPLNE